jgi:putative ABC transport system permease protein
MKLFALISWPYVRKHAVRSLLTLIGIVIGISVFVAMHGANESVFNGFRDTVDRIAGVAELQVSAGEPGFDEEYLERVQSLKEVKAAAPVVEAVASVGLPEEGNLLMLGVDMTGDRSLREYDLESGETAIVEDPLVFLAQPDSLMITTDFAHRNGLEIGSAIPLETVDGVKRFTVRGILRSGGLTSAFGGNIAVMDIYAAQHMFGRGRKFDRIDVVLTPGVSLNSAQEAIQKAVGMGFQVQPPASRGQSFQSMLSIYYFMMSFSSVFALVIAVFIVYNTFSVAVTQRRKEIGILRALGATRRQIGLLFLGESIIASLMGSGVGLVLGHYAAAEVASVLRSILQGVYGAVSPASEIELSWSIIITSLGVGMVTGVIGALIPAANAARVEPVKALQKGRIHMVTESEHHMRVLAFGVLLVTALIVIVFTRSLFFFYIGYLSMIIAVVLLTPKLSVWLARALRPVLSRLFPVEGTLAADSLIGAPRRTSATVAALMLSLALIIGLGGTARASYVNIMDWVHSALNPDLYVSSSQTLTSHSYRFPQSMSAELETIPGVEQVQKVRNARIEYNGEVVLLMVNELEKIAERTHRKAIEGDVEEMFRRASAGEGVIASENFAAIRRLHLGDRLSIPSPRGQLDVPILGIVREYSDQQGALLVDRELYKKYWNDDSVDLFRVYVRSGTSPQQVRQEILSRYSGNRKMFVLFNEEVRKYVAGITDQWFGMTWIQVSISIVVAILGIVNSLTVTVTDRRRELAVLRAVGGMRTQIRRTIWMEALGIAVISLVLGLALGAPQLYFVLEISARDFPGMRFDYIYPLSIAMMLVPLIMTAALLSSIGPAESAVRGSLVEALEYE